MSLRFDQRTTGVDDPGEGPISMTLELGVMLAILVTHPESSLSILRIEPIN